MYILIILAVSYFINLSVEKKSFKSFHRGSNKANKYRKIKVLNG